MPSAISACECPICQKGFLLTLAPTAPALVLLLKWQVLIYSQLFATRRKRRHAQHPNRTRNPL